MCDTDRHHNYLHLYDTIIIYVSNILNHGFTYVLHVIAFYFCMVLRDILYINTRIIRLRNMEGLLVIKTLLAVEICWISIALLRGHYLIINNFIKI